MNRFSPAKIGDILTLQRGFDITKIHQTDGGYPVVSSGGIASYHAEYKVLGPGVVIGRKGTLGSAFFLESPFWPHDTTLWVKDFKGNHPKFIYYFLKALPLERLDSGSSNPTLNRNVVHQILAFKPSAEDQSNIADVLSSLDRKIDLNNRLNEELEGMAKLLYDYWFVQFDFPITAAQATAMGNPALEGKPYRASGGKMTYNETLKREIPDGWIAPTLSEFANITMGQSPPGTSYNQAGSGVVFFQGSTDFGRRFPLVREFTTSPSRRAKEGDILLSVRAPVGTLNIADQDCCIGRGLAALNSKSGHDSFLYEVMLYFKMIFDRRNSAGTTFGSITKDDLHSLRFACPPAGSPLLDAFEERTKPAHKTTLLNHRQNLELASLRDWLLPMLMNGQVTVKCTLPESPP